MGEFRFRKEERLNKKKLIEDLFGTGASFTSFPLKVVYKEMPRPATPPHQILISVPVRHFKKAVDRNTIKRRIREGYRQNKALFSMPHALCIAYIYIAREILPSSEIHKGIESSARRLISYEKKS